MHMLETRLDRWKKELLDTGKRNKMINYRETRRTTLRILEPSPEELFNKLAVSEKELTFRHPVSRDSDFRTYAMLSLLETLHYSIPVQRGDIRAAGTISERDQTLGQMRSRTKLAQEEQGTNILYLCFGFILWRESGRESAPWLKAPLLLMPVSLGRKAMNAPYTLKKHDDEIVVNPTLDYLFNQNYGIDLPAFELKNRQSFESYLTQIEELVDKKGWRVVREVSLGLLSFLKISMYHDLSDNADLIMKNPVIRAIAGDAEALKQISDGASEGEAKEGTLKEGTLKEGALKDGTEGAKTLTRRCEVVDADSSQEEAIRLSRQGVSFVMQGPPGTGKSQTITNIIGQALYDGKKVLFVSEKAAALQVVLKRLTETGLAEFCLPLHDYKANKKEIISAIGANLSLTAEYPDRTLVDDLSALFQDKKYLDAYAGALHEAILPLGESIYTAFGKYAGLKDAAAIPFRIENAGEVSKETYASYLYAVEALEKALSDLEGPLTDNPWCGSSVFSGGAALAEELDEKCAALPQLLYELEGAVLTLNRSCGACVLPTWEGVREGIRKIEPAFSLPLLPAEWLHAGKRQYARELAKRKLDDGRELNLHLRSLRSLTEGIRGAWQPGASALMPAQLRSIVSDPALKENMHIPLSQANRNALGRLDDSARQLEEMTERCDKAADLLNLDREETIAGMLRLSDILETLAAAPEMEAAWFDVRKNPDFAAMAQEAASHQEAYSKETDEILKSWERGVLTMDVEGMLARFKTEYRGFFYRWKSSYREDMKQVRLLHKTVGVPITETQVIRLLNQLVTIRSHREWFEERDIPLRNAFPKYYAGLDTDWAKVRAGVQAAGEIAGRFPYGSIRKETIEAILHSGSSLQQAAEIRALAGGLKRETLLGLVSQAGGAGDDLSVKELLALVRKKQEQLRERGDRIAQLDALKSGQAATCQDVEELLENAAKIRREMIWLRENVSAVGGLKDIDASLRRMALSSADIGEMVSGADRVLETVSVGTGSENEDEKKALFGSWYAGEETDWQAVLKMLDTADDVLPDAGEICVSGETRALAQTHFKRIKELLAAAETGFTYFANLFPKRSFAEMALHEVTGQYNACRGSMGELSEWIDYTQTKSECDSLGLKEFTDRIEALNNSVPDVKGAFERGFYRQWLDAVTQTVPPVRNFRRRLHERRLAEYQMLDEKQFGWAKERIRERIIWSFPDRDTPATAKSERGILLHEMEKKRRIMPLRQLFHRIPNLLLTLKPCLMMSPLSVAYFLNAQDYHFDMVIFDEASQIFPEDAIGAIFRADQVIIAGDTRQLPPTNFFAVSTSNHEADETEDWEEEVYDSILEETASVLENRTLLWHYRSRHENLIAFSNREIYKGDLITFPDPKNGEPDTGVEFVYVEDGFYESGGRNCNVPEAKRCAQLVKEHIDRHPDRSLGIIAFSEKQQRAIALEIARFREQNPAYEAFFAEGKDEEFFVKNLENVQGDERDTILLSIGYARTKEQIAAGKPMAMRFGPLMNAGGERRLNVAVTRAKVNIKLVSSILPSDIDLSRTGSEGTRMLRAYLEFAVSGGSALRASGQRPGADIFADAVAAFIRSKGYRVRQNVGSSEYKVGIAVEHPEREGEYIAGIECDGRTYVSAGSTRDRDRLRGAVLAKKGWNMYRVWSAGWYQDPEAEGARLTEFLEKAVQVVSENADEMPEPESVQQEQGTPGQTDVTQEQ